MAVCGAQTRGNRPLLAVLAGGRSRLPLPVTGSEQYRAVLDNHLRLALLPATGTDRHRHAPEPPPAAHREACRSTCPHSDGTCKSCHRPWQPSLPATRAVRTSRGSSWSSWWVGLGCSWAPGASCGLRSLRPKGTRVRQVHATQFWELHDVRIRVARGFSMSYAHTFTSYPGVKGWAFAKVRRKNAIRYRCPTPLCAAL